MMSCLHTQPLQPFSLYGQVVEYHKNLTCAPQMCYKYSLTSLIEILTFHSKESTGVTNNINEGSVEFKCPDQPQQWASTHNTRTLRLEQPNGIQPSFTLSFTPVLFYGDISPCLQLKNGLKIDLEQKAVKWEIPQLCPPAVRHLHSMTNELTASFLSETDTGRLVKLFISRKLRPTLYFFQKETEVVFLLWGNCHCAWSIVTKDVFVV